MIGPASPHVECYPLRRRCSGRHADTPHFEGVAVPKEIPHCWRPVTRFIYSSGLFSDDAAWSRILPSRPVNDTTVKGCRTAVCSHCDFQLPNDFVAFISATYVSEDFLANIPQLDWDPKARIARRTEHSKSLSARITATVAVSSFKKLQMYLCR